MVSVSVLTILLSMVFFAYLNPGEIQKTDRNLESNNIYLTNIEKREITLDNQVSTFKFRHLICLSQTDFL